MKESQTYRLTEFRKYRCPNKNFRFLHNIYVHIIIFILGFVFFFNFASYLFFKPSRSEEVQPKLKSIISRNKLSSQDSSEKHVTFQDSENVNESSVKSKRVKFADDTIFKPEPKVTRGKYFNDHYRAI